MIQAERHNPARFWIFAGIFTACLSLSLLEQSNYYLLIPFGMLAVYLGWNEPRFVFYLMLFTLPLSTELRVTGELSTDFPDELLMVLMTGLVICHLAFKPGMLRRKHLTHPLMLLLFLSLLWTCVAVSGTDYPLLSLKFLAAKSWYIGAFLFAPLIFMETRRMIYAIKLALVAIVLTVVYTMVKHAIDGFSFASINEAVRPFFRNHVNYSSMLVCFIPIAYTFYRMSKSRTWKRTMNFVLIIMLAALFFSYARGAWLALAAGVCGWWLIKKRMLVVAYLAFILITIGLIAWVQHEKRYLQYAHDYRSTIYHEDFKEHLRATYEMKDVSTAERFYRWIAGVRMVEERPIHGFGPGTFYSNYKGFAIPAYKTWVSKNEEQSTVHNYFLLITLEQGIPALVIFLLLTGAMLWYAQKLYHQNRDRISKIIALNCGVILVMILTVNFLSDLIETDKVGSLFLLCLASLVSVSTDERPPV